MAGAGREASKPKGYFFKLLWVRSCSTWCTYTVPCKVSPSSPSEGLPQTQEQSQRPPLPAPGN